MPSPALQRNQLAGASRQSANVFIQDSILRNVATDKLRECGLQKMLHVCAQDVDFDVYWNTADESLLKGLSVRVWHQTVSSESGITYKLRHFTRDS